MDIFTSREYLAKIIPFFFILVGSILKKKIYYLVGTFSFYIYGYSVPTLGPCAPPPQLQSMRCSKKKISLIFRIGASFFIVCFLVLRDKTIEWGDM